LYTKYFSLPLKSLKAIALMSLENFVTANEGKFQLHLVGYGNNNWKGNNNYYSVSSLPTSVDYLSNPSFCKNLTLFYSKAVSSIPLYFGNLRKLLVCIRKSDFNFNGITIQGFLPSIDLLGVPYKGNNIHLWADDKSNNNFSQDKKLLNELANSCLSLNVFPFVSTDTSCGYLIPCKARDEKSLMFLLRLFFSEQVIPWLGDFSLLTNITQPPEGKRISSANEYCSPANVMNLIGKLHKYLEKKYPVEKIQNAFVGIAKMSNLYKMASIKPSVELMLKDSKSEQPIVESLLEQMGLFYQEC
jgi:hypothetical protein